MITGAPFAVSAPGKAFLMGEYAVLEGADAVVMAVTRRVFLRPGCGGMRPLVARARRAAAIILGHPDLAEASWEADSTDLYFGRMKLGIGSSAAVVAAAVGAVIYESGEAIASPEVRSRIWDIAHRVHDEWQRTRGSGADIAACVFGGTVMFGRDASGEVHIAPWAPPPGIRFEFVWTGRSASTPAMMRAARRLRTACLAPYEAVIAEMAVLARRFALEGSRDPLVVFDSFEQYGRAMERLGRLAGAAVMTPVAEAIALVARRFGGAAKPSGAGGGDLVVAALPEDADIEAFRAALGPGQHEFLDVDSDKDGVRVEVYGE